MFFINGTGYVSHALLLSGQIQDICPYIRPKIYLARMGHMLENGYFGFRLLPAQHKFGIFPIRFQLISKEVPK